MARELAVGTIGDMENRTSEQSLSSEWNEEQQRDTEEVKGWPEQTRGTPCSTSSSTGPTCATCDSI